MVAGPGNRPPHRHAASEKLNSVVRVVQTGPPAPEFAFCSPCIQISSARVPTSRDSLSISSQANYGGKRNRTNVTGNRVTRELGIGAVVRTFPAFTHSTHLSTFLSMIAELM